MVIPQLRYYCLVLLLCLPFSVHSQVYKWVDENGLTHYSQEPPTDRPAQQIKIPAPPPIDHEKANQEVDELIESQQIREAAREQAEAQREYIAEQEKTREENCATARNNLQQYENNPGRRVMNEAGEVTRPTEEERQQKILDFKEQVDNFCQ